MMSYLMRNGWVSSTRYGLSSLPLYPFPILHLSFLLFSSLSLSLYSLFSFLLSPLLYVIYAADIIGRRGPVRRLSIHVRNCFFAFSVMADFRIQMPERTICASVD